MVSAQTGRLRSLLRRTNFWDRATFLIIVFYALVAALRGAGAKLPAPGILGFLFVLSLGYFVFVRGIGWVRRRLMWKLRDRLIVAYLFIAVVPVLLLVTIVALSAYLLYWQFGAYAVYNDLQKRQDEVAATAETLATSLAVEAIETGKPVNLLDLPQHTAAFLGIARRDLPGLEFKVGEDEELLKRSTVPPHSHFSGFVQDKDQLLLAAVIARPVPTGRLVVSVSVPVTPGLIATLGPELGPIQVNVMHPTDETNPQGLVYSSGGRLFVAQREILSPGRSVPPKSSWFDVNVRGVSKMNAIDKDAISNPAADLPVFVSFSTRPSRLNERLFASVGDLGGIAVDALLVVGVVFLVIEVAALIIGIVLTRSITSAVNDLYGATQRVQAGDFSYRVNVQRRDQLGELGASFNTMTESVSTLLGYQRQRARMENELTLAREVQAQLFPRELPSMPGIELEAVWRAARGVSGDYYDFLVLSPTQLGIALGDISGKGISAALLMANLQASLRSEAGLDGPVPVETAKVVTRLNRHFCRSSSEGRFATFFYGVYDLQSRTLQYTNAGHLPPVCISGGKIRMLEAGGMVLGIYDDRVYQQETVEIDPGTLFFAFSDGLIEPENVYGEEFGTERLVDEAVRHARSSASAVAQALMAAVDQWAGTPEQADDMTVIVARFQAASTAADAARGAG
jgi:sigma-B regulation protein RsbU (phosphoserine phosphatase)